LAAAYGRLILCHQPPPRRPSYPDDLDALSRISFRPL
jgi:hypothetical protein